MKPLLTLCVAAAVMAGTASAADRTMTTSRAQNSGERSVSREETSGMAPRTDIRRESSREMRGFSLFGKRRSATVDPTTSANIAEDYERIDRTKGDATDGF